MYNLTDKCTKKRDLKSFGENRPFQYQLPLRQQPVCSYIGLFVLPVPEKKKEDPYVENSIHNLTKKVDISDHCKDERQTFF